MDPLSEIRKSIRGMATRTGKSGCFTAKVKAVNGETCSVELDGLTLTDVRLRAVVNGENSKILVTPKTDSYVLIADLSGNLSQLVVVGYSEVEKIEIDAENKIIFNGGNNHGLVNIDDLTQKLNELVNTFNSHTHNVKTTGTAAAQSGTSAVPSTEASQFDKSFYEDTNITH